jgi:hypothetical protein
MTDKKLPSNDDLKETLDLLGRIAAGTPAYDDLPSNDDLKETLDLLGRLPTNEELDETIAKLERIAELKAEAE